MSDRAVTCTAQNAEVGMPLRPQHPGWPHRVESVRVTDSGQYVITTNQGEWEFRPGERLFFPRRANGETTDWRAESRAPFLGELCYGDVLPEPLPVVERMPPPWQDPRWETAADHVKQRLEREWAARGQRVMAITPAPKSDGHLFVITTRSGAHSNGRWFVRDDQPVEFPLAKNRAYAEAVDHKIRALIGHGPYELPDQRLAFMVEHPYRVGRWPAWLTHPIKIGGNVVLMRPPGKHDEWPDLLGFKTDDQLAHGFKFSRHPHDPKWGLYDADKIAHRRLIEEALKTYDDYRKRYES